ncbi:MAG: MSMEG_6728 family protein [Kineosporiaceae bacterium]
MQTFVPCPDFATSAAVLDARRLGKQRVEAFQLLRALTLPEYGWKHHPATKMWRGFVPALVAYGLTMAHAWVERGFADSTRASLLEFTGGEEPDVAALARDGGLPPWLGRADLHLSHRSALARKDPEHYGAVFGDVDPELPYVWPRPLFRRWPLPVADDAALAGVPIHEATRAVGVPEPDELGVVVSRLRDGEHVRLTPSDLASTPAEPAKPRRRASGPPPVDAHDWAVLAGLATEGRTAWIDVTAPPLEPVLASVPSSASSSAAPGQALAPAPFAVLRPGQAVPEGTGLVVLTATVQPQADATGAALARAEAALQADRTGTGLLDLTACP